MKVLALKFKLLGDVAIMVTSLRALKEHWPDAELHVLVREEAVPVLNGIPWLHKVWGIPRSFKRGGIQRLVSTLAQLRRLNFDRSVDFEGNDRGAFLSFLVAARERLGSMAGGGFVGRRTCYTEVISKAPNGIHEVYRDLHTLDAWRIPRPHNLGPETYADRSRAGLAASILPSRGAVIAHLSTSQPKKEWPLECWAELAKRAAQAGIPLFFSSGVSPRERALLQKLSVLYPDAALLKEAPDLGTFISVIARSSAFVSGDTGPLHLAAGLGVKTIGIFGPSDMKQWLPMSENSSGLTGPPCTCDGHVQSCESEMPCIRGVSVGDVWGKICEYYDKPNP